VREKVGPAVVDYANYITARGPLAAPECRRGDAALGDADPEHEPDGHAGTTELGGQAIREGDRLLLLYPSGNRDERVFEQPERFDIRRSPNQHMAFGGYGRHHCLGAQLARLELTVLFDELLDRFPDLGLADPEAPLQRRRGNFVLGLEHLPVRTSR
jgi:cytochrome P450